MCARNGGSKSPPYGDIKPTDKPKFEYHTLEFEPRRASSASNRTESGFIGEAFLRFEAVSRAYCSLQQKKDAIGVHASNGNLNPARLWRASHVAPAVSNGRLFLAT